MNRKFGSPAPRSPNTAYKTAQNRTNPIANYDQDDDDDDADSEERSPSHVYKYSSSRNWLNKLRHLICPLICFGFILILGAVVLYIRLQNADANGSAEPKNAKLPKASAIGDAQPAQPPPTDAQYAAQYDSEIHANPTYGPPFRDLTLSDMLSGHYDSEPLDDGIWSGDERIYRDRAAMGNLVAINVRTGRKRILLLAHESDDLRTSDSFQVSADGKLVLLEHPVHKVFRHSRMSEYSLHRLPTHRVFGRPMSTRLSVSSARMRNSQLMNYAAFGPADRQLVLINERSIYYYADAADALGLRPPLAIDRTGSVTVFNGIPDWTYEEFMYGKQKALWFSPDGHRLAYVRFDCTAGGRRVNSWRYADQRQSLRCPAEEESEDDGGGADGFGEKPQETFDRMASRTERMRRKWWQWRWQSEYHDQPVRYAVANESMPLVSVHVVDLRRMPNDARDMADIRQRWRYAYTLPMPTLSAVGEQLRIGEHVMGGVGWASDRVAVFLVMNRRQNGATVQACKVVDEPHRTDCWQVSTCGVVACVPRRQ